MTKRQVKIIRIFNKCNRLVPVVCIFYLFHLIICHTYAILMVVMYGLTEECRIKSIQYLIYCNDKVITMNVFFIFAMKFCYCMESSTIWCSYLNRKVFEFATGVCYFGWSGSLRHTNRMLKWYFGLRTKQLPFPLPPAENTARKLSYSYTMKPQSSLWYIIYLTNS